MTNTKKDDLKRVKPKYPKQELNVIIPLAVSVNHLYKFVKGKRFMTKQGEKYMKDVFQITSHAINIQNYNLEQEGVWLVAELRFYYPDKRRRDCHNQHKLIMDALEGVAFHDDRWVMVRDMYVGLDRDFPRVEVTIYPSEYAEK